MRTPFQSVYARFLGSSVAGRVPGGLLWGLALLVLAKCISPEAAPHPSPRALADEDSILNTVELPDGYAATVFARPPQISYPTFVKPTYDGPVFVAIDQNGSLGTDPGRGSVAACYDDTEDGVANRCTSFVPDVDSPRGLEWDGEWLYVLHPPHLSAFRDTDGDGVADESRRLIDGIAFPLDERPADHTSNGVTLGIDGFLYLAIGDFGFMEAVGSDGTTAQLRGGGIVRVRPDGSDLEIFARGTRNIYEAAVDPLLNAFARGNTNDGGGWNVRLHHFTGLEHHGYPSLYANFGDEIVQPLADYGGGSGTGAHYLYEPGFPNDDGDHLYTVDWGRSGVFRHTLARDGATFEEEAQEQVFTIDRVTDLAVDGRSRLYAASWSGGRFRYSGDDVGYVLQITPEGYDPPPFPALDSLSVPDLVALFERPSATLHLAAQQEILRRAPTSVPSAAALARDTEQAPATRVAALFTLQQALGTGAVDVLLDLTDDPEIGALAVRALGDPDLAPDVDASTFAEALTGSDARTRLEAAVAAARSGDPSLHEPLLQLTADPDPVVAHTAVKALVKMQAADASLSALDDPTLPNEGAFRVLQELHDEAAVDALIAKLDEDALAPDVRAGIFSVLARLAVREGEWDGSSWGTRPDTQGPYYFREDWAATDQIQSTLQHAMEDDRTDRSQLLAAMAINQLIDASYLPQVRALAEEDPSLEATYVQALLMQEETPQDAFPLLERIALGNDRQGNIRVQAAQALARTGDPEAVRAAFPVIAAAGDDVEAYRQVAEAAREALLATPLDQFGTAWLLEQTASEAPRPATLAWGLLLQHAYNPDTPTAEQEQIGEGIATAKNRPDAFEVLLQAAEAFQIWGAEDLVREAYEHTDADVRAQAEETAEELHIDLSGEDADRPTVASMTPENVIEAVAQTEGNVALGEALFNRQTCTTCHTVDPAEPLKGPFLGNIASTFNRAELTMAILDPGATIAQGFITHLITLEDGRSMTGFVTQEGAEEVALRNAAGRATTLAVDDIAERRTVEVSMMPAGLAAHLTVHELASILAYLEKLDEEL